jgi:hypothetical protein
MDDHDPLDRLLDELLDAHDRLQTEDQPSRLISKRFPHGLSRRLILISGLVLTLSASAAATIVVGTRTSAPLSGSTPRELLNSHYSIRVAPDLDAGHSGWCIALLTGQAEALMSPLFGTCVSPTGPVVLRGSLIVVSAHGGAQTGWLLYAIVRRQVTEILAPGTTLVRPISSPDLPSAWRAAVVIQSNASLGAPIQVAPKLIALDARGQAVTARASKATVIPARDVDPQHPPTTGCSIRVSGAMPELSLQTAQALSVPVPKSLPVDAGFLACYSLRFKLRGRSGLISQLLDARNTASRPANLPGLRRLKDHPGVWVGVGVSEGSGASPGGSRLFAERRGNSWLVVQTTASASDTLGLLSRLVVKR